MIFSITTVLFLMFFIIDAFIITFFYKKVLKNEDIKKGEKIFLKILLIINLIYGLITIGKVILSLIVRSNTEAVIFPVAEFIIFPLVALILYALIHLIIEMIIMFVKKENIKIGITVSLIHIYLLFYIFFLFI